MFAGVSSDGREPGREAAGRVVPQHVTSTPENEITEGLSHRSARIVRPTVARLARTGDIDREDREDGPALFGLD